MVFELCPLGFELAVLDGFELLASGFELAVLDGV
jgi:hypothetical protein